MTDDLAELSDSELDAQIQSCPSGRQKEMLLQEQQDRANEALRAEFSTPTGSCTVKIYGWPGTTGAPGVCIGTLYFTADPSVRITPGFRYNCQEERVIDIHGKKRIAFLITTVVGNVVLRGHGF